MFRYPDAKVRKIVAAEQRCCYCLTWIQLAPVEVKKLQKRWEVSKTWNTPKSIGLPFDHVTCPHCKEKQILITPGKYDNPGTPKRQCSMQFQTFDRGNKKMKHSPLIKGREITAADLLPVKRNVRSAKVSKAFSVVASLPLSQRNKAITQFGKELGMSKTEIRDWRIFVRNQ